MSAPYDRALALASQVRTMRDHYLAVSCSCGARRVVALQQMAKDPRLSGCTMADVALRIRCQGCYDGPDEVHLTATIHGAGPAPAGTVSLVWTLPLVERPAVGARRLRYVGAGHGRRPFIDDQDRPDDGAQFDLAAPGDSHA